MFIPVSVVTKEFSKVCSCSSINTRTVLVFGGLDDMVLFATPRSVDESREVVLLNYHRISLSSFSLPSRCRSLVPPRTCFNCCRRVVQTRAHRDCSGTFSVSVKTTVASLCLTSRSKGSPLPNTRRHLCREEFPSVSLYGCRALLLDRGLHVGARGLNVATPHSIEEAVRRRRLTSPRTWLWQHGTRNRCMLPPNRADHRSM